MNSGYTMTILAPRWLPRLTPIIARYFVAVALVGFALDGGIYSVLLNLFLLRLGYGPEQIGLVNAAGTPPSTGICAPVVLDERSDSRKRTVSATSSPVTVRRRSVRAA